MRVQDRTSNDFTSYSPSHIQLGLRTSARMVASTAVHLRVGAEGRRALTASLLHLLLDVTIAEALRSSAAIAIERLKKCGFAVARFEAR